jgi:hypothetical protein
MQRERGEMKPRSDREHETRCTTHSTEHCVGMGRERWGARGRQACSILLRGPHDAAEEGAALCARVAPARRVALLAPKPSPRAPHCPELGRAVAHHRTARARRELAFLGVYGCRRGWCRWW